MQHLHDCYCLLIVWAIVYMCVEVEHVCIIPEHRRALIRVTHMLSFTHKVTPVAAAEATHLCEMALIHHLHLLLFFTT